jgi:hypothetical protein
MWLVKGLAGLMSASRGKRPGRSATTVASRQVRRGNEVLFMMMKRDRAVAPGRAKN